MTNIDYTLWPNAGGTLGQNKVQIPDGIITTWPEGDALVGNFVYNKGNLVGFVDTKALIANESKSTTFPYDYVNIQVDKSLEGVMTFNQGERTKYLTISYAESGNSSDESFDFVIIDFNTTDQETIDAVRTAYRVVDKKMYDADGNVIGTWDTSKIEVGGVFDADAMMADGLYCDVDFNTFEKKGITLTEFSSDLSSLRDGANMFMYCSNLESFSSDLSSLTNGYGMFGYTNLESFSSDLSSLTNGEFMFYGSGLESFSSDLSSLTNGYKMFYGCTNLTSFSSNLSSLMNGQDMFDGCKLDAPSFRKIIDTINTYQGGITIGLGCNSEEAVGFILAAGYTDLESYTAALAAKKWEMDLQFNGRPTSTYGLRKPSENTLPVFAKLEEDEKHGNYTSEDGTKKYSLRWFHMTTGSTDGYT